MTNIISNVIDYVKARRALFATLLALYIVGMAALACVATYLVIDYIGGIAGFPPPNVLQTIGITVFIFTLKGFSLRFNLSYNRNNSVNRNYSN